jgi:hypothetical protein
MKTTYSPSSLTPCCGPRWESPPEVGAGGGRAPSPHKEAMPGAQTEPCSPPLAKSGRFPWEILEEVLR